MEKQIDRLTELLRLAKKARFGASSEKARYILADGFEQGSLFNEAEGCADEDAPESCVTLHTMTLSAHRTTILSSVRLAGTIVPCVFEDALNGELFRKYIREFLVPTLHSEDIVAMDNLSSHKVTGIIEAGASVMFLPPYSPDFNPIELMWSKIKAILRKLKIRCKELLD